MKKLLFSIIIAGIFAFVISTSISCKQTPPAINVDSISIDSLYYGTGNDTIPVDTVLVD